MDYEGRRERLRRAMAKAKIDTLLVTNHVNVTYLTGFTGEDSYLLLHRGGEVVISDHRFTTQLKEECPDLDLHIRKPGVAIHEAAVRVLRWAKISRLGVEADSMTLGLQAKIAEKLPKLAFAPTSGLVEELRMIKDDEEVALVRQAVRDAEKAFAVLRASLRPDKSEKLVADELEYQLRLFGARCSAFPTIVGVGPRSALPHAVPTRQQVGEGSFILIDWGARSGLYHSDLTRVLVTGRIPAKFEQIYRIVLEAQGRAIAAVRPGVSAQEVDAVARGIIDKAGYGKRFGHGLGHGLGLEVHEAPRLAANNDTVLKEGMVLTVEPGIYLPDWGGVRIEDDVLVTRRGCEVLTSVPKQWEDAVVV